MFIFVLAFCSHKINDSLLNSEKNYWNKSVLGTGRDKKWTSGQTRNPPFSKVILSAHPRPYMKIAVRLSKRLLNTNMSYPCNVKEDVL